MSHFKEFLLTGRIGTLDFQQDLSTVRDTLGEPGYFDRKPNVVPEHLLTVSYYGNLEIVRLDDEFHKFKISFQASEEFDFVTALDIRWYSQLAEMDYGSFKEFVIQNQIGCREIVFPFPVEETGYAIEISSTKIQVVFNLPPVCGIQSVHYEPSLSGKLNYKPLVE